MAHQHSVNHVYKTLALVSVFQVLPLKGWSQGLVDPDFGREILIIKGDQGRGTGTMVLCTLENLGVSDAALYWRRYRR